MPRSVVSNIDRLIRSEERIVCLAAMEIFVSTTFEVCN